MTQCGAEFKFVQSGDAPEQQECGDTSELQPGKKEVLSVDSRQLGNYHYHCFLNSSYILIKSHEKINIF